MGETGGEWSDFRGGKKIEEDEQGKLQLAHACGTHSL